MRLYELTVVIPEKRGKPTVTKKIRFRSKDSVHASISVMGFFGKRSGAKVISAVLVKEDENGKGE